MNYDLISEKVSQQVDAILARPPYDQMSEDRKLETRTQLITSLYTNAIQQEEEKRVRILPPPPPPRPTVGLHDLTDALNNSVVPTIKKSNKEIQLDALLSGLPLRIQKEIKASLGETLGGNSSLPAQQDLTEFIERAERVLEGISPDFGIDDLDRRHIQVLAPTMLGRATWDEVKDTTYQDWTEFKYQLNKLYGLSRQQLEEAFFDMRMQGEETSHDFILRVEQKRRKYGFNEQECYRAFKATLPLSYWQKLDDAREFAVLCDEDAEIQINWATLVRRARHATKNISLGMCGQGKMVAGFEPAGVQIPRRGTAIAVPPRPQLREQPLTGSFAFKQPECQLCKETGKENLNTHETHECWANPYSERYRKSSYEARLLECYRKNIPIPQLMQVYINKAENQPVQKPPDAVNAFAHNQESNKSTRFSEEQARQFHSDLQAQLSNPGNDIYKAITQALEDNFGSDHGPNTDHVPDPGPACMFTHCDTDQSERGSIASSILSTDHKLCGVTQTTREVQLEALKGHLKELAKFSEAELIAALEDATGAASTYQAGERAGETEMSVDGPSDSENDSNDGDDRQDDYLDEEATMAKVIKELRQKALARKKAQERKAKDKKAKGQTTQQKLDKIKFMLPFLEALMLKRNLRGLILNYAVDYAYQNDETLRVRKGTKVKEVSERRLLAERAIYQSAGVDEENQVMNKLRNLKLSKEGQTRDRQQLVKEYTESLGDILLGLMTEKDKVDQSFTGALVTRDHMAAYPPQQWKWPTWMKDKIEVNALGKVKLSDHHYMGAVVLGGVLLHAMLDTCGAKSMMDRKSAEELGYDIEIATKQKHFGSFYGPGGKVVYYYGRIKGPIEIWIDEEVKLVAPEIKVVEHFEPLVLLGTDVLTEGSTKWNFCYIGLHPTSREGKLVVVNQKGKTKEIPLTSWPLNGKNAKIKVQDTNSLAAMTTEDGKLDNLLKKAKHARETEQARAKNKKEKVKDTGAKAALLSLLRQQGQCL